MPPIESVKSLWHERASLIGELPSVSQQIAQFHANRIEAIENKIIASKVCDSDDLHCKLLWLRELIELDFAKDHIAYRLTHSLIKDCMQVSVTIL